VDVKGGKGGKEGSSDRGIEKSWFRDESGNASGVRKPLSLFENFGRINLDTPDSSLQNTSLISNLSIPLSEQTKHTKPSYLRYYAYR